MITSNSVDEVCARTTPRKSEHTENNKPQRHKDTENNFLLCVLVSLWLNISVSFELFVSLLLPARAQRLSIELAASKVDARNLPRIPDVVERVGVEDDEIRAL